MAKDKWEINKDSGVSEVEAKKSLRIVRTVYTLITLFVGSGLFWIWTVLPPEGKVGLLIAAGMCAIIWVAIVYGEDIIDWFWGIGNWFGDHRDNIRIAKQYGVNDE